MADYVDLIHFADLLVEHGEDRQITTAARRVGRYARACVHYSKRLGANVEKAQGLSVWFPALRHVYFGNRSRYLELKGNRGHPGWVAFLDAIHA